MTAETCYGKIVNKDRENHGGAFETVYGKFVIKGNSDIKGEHGDAVETKKGKFVSKRRKLPETKVAASLEAVPAPDAAQCRVRYMCSDVKIYFEGGVCRRSIYSATYAYHLQRGESDKAPPLGLKWCGLTDPPV